MLSTGPALFRQSSSHAKVTDVSRDLAAIRDLVISPAHLIKPQRRAMSEGSMYERMAYLLTAPCRNF